MTIKLPIFHHSETSETLKNCGVNYCIHSNGSEYICSIKIHDVLEIINKNKKN